jgi:Tol biopolymer transport system component
MRWAPDGLTIAYEVDLRTDFPSGSNGTRSVFYRSEIDVVDVTNGTTRVLTSRPGQQASIGDWSPDGRSLAFAGYADGVTPLDSATGEPTRRMALFTVSPNAMTEHQLTPPLPDLELGAWSPDGQSLGFIASDAGAPTLDVIDPAQPDSYVTGPAASYFTWSPDGRQLLFVSPTADTLAVINTSFTGNPTSILKVATTSSDGAISCPLWLPATR